jgi:HAD superfamily hydrolase (TIGR01549 family)
VIAGVIFDLDGTLVDSGLDFEAMRREMELPPGLPILESIERLEPARAAECHTTLERHEREGVERATLLTGVKELLAELARRDIRTAIATRNSRAITRATQQKLGLSIEPALTRDDGPVKPDAWPVLRICQGWGVKPAEVVVVGDYRFDVESGRAAGAHTVLLTHPHDPRQYPNDERADLLLASLAEYPRLLAWLDSL